MVKNSSLLNKIEQTKAKKSHIEEAVRTLETQLIIKPSATPPLYV